MNGAEKAEGPKSNKRRRVPVACRRCKARKQKCDPGSKDNTTCASCEKANAECVYDTSWDNREWVDPEYVAHLEKQVRYYREIVEAQELDKSEQARDQLSSNLLTVYPFYGDSQMYIGNTSGAWIVQTIRDKMTVDIPKEELYMTVAVDDKAPRPVSLDPMPEMTRETEVQLITFFMQKCHNRYPVLERPSFCHIVARRTAATDPWELFLLNVVFAIGSRYMELMEGTVDVKPERYYQLARVYLSRAKLNRFQYVQACFLCALYIHRARNTGFGPSMWLILGSGMRTAVEIGLHRRQPVNSKQDPFHMEYRKRLFWTGYLLDRLLSTTLGRPFSVPEHDIDLQLPVSINDDTQDERALRSLRLAQDQGEMVTGLPITCMTSVIHMIKLRRIESEIQQAMYSVAGPSTDPEKSVQHYSAILDLWLAEIPQKESLQSRIEAYENYDYFNLCYFRAKRLLLAPVFAALTPEDIRDDYIFKEYVRISGGICQSYKLLHQKFILGYSPVALQTLFLSGVTLAYCVWLNKDLLGSKVLSDIRACSNVLFVLAERWEHAKKYHDVYEKLVDLVLTQERASKEVHSNVFHVFRELPDNMSMELVDFNFWEMFENPAPAL